MRRLYILESLGLDDLAVKFVVLSIVLLFVETIIAENLRKKNQKAGKKASSGWLHLVRIGTVAAVALAWYMTAHGIPLMKADKLLAEGKYDEAIAAYEELEEYSRRQQALEQYAAMALEAGDTDLAAEIYERMGLRDQARALLADKAEAELAQGDLEAAASEMAELLCSPEGAKKLLENTALRDALFIPGRAVNLEIGKTWYIAAVEEDRILVVQRYENQDYLREQADVITWKDSVLRENLQFLRSFMQPLRSAILLTRNKNLTNDHGVIVPGEDTEDYVFVLTAEEAAAYLGPVASYFAGESYWIRTPVEGSTTDGYAAEISLDENGEVKLSLSTHTLILSQPVLAAMWVDTNLLLQGWAEF